MLNDFTKKPFIEQWVFFFLAATLLALPLSSTGKSIFLGLSVGAILFTPAFRNDFLSVFKTTWCKSALFLFLIALIASLWSPAKLGDVGYVIEKYSKLLYLPILAVGFQNKDTREAALKSFVLAMLIICGLSVLKFHGFLSTLQFDPDHAFRNHIMTSLMTSFAAYIVFLFAYQQRNKYVMFIYILIGIFFTYQIFFINTSRTGYISYSLLMTTFVLQHFTWRHAIYLIGAIYLSFITCYFLSPNMQKKVNEVKHGFYNYQENKDTNIGLRLQFHKYASDLFYKHPILGNGTSSFTYYFDKEKPVLLNWRLWEPHSLYWLIVSEWGIVGLMALLLFFGSLISACKDLNQMKVIAFALLITYMIGNLSDSLLFYSGSGYFFILFIALCLGESVEKTKIGYS